MMREIDAWSRSNKNVKVLKPPKILFGGDHKIRQLANRLDSLSFMKQLFEGKSVNIFPSNGANSWKWDGAPGIFLTNDPWFENAQEYRKLGYDNEFVGNLKPMLERIVAFTFPTMSEKRKNKWTTKGLFRPLDPQQLAIYLAAYYAEYGHEMAKQQEPEEHTWNTDDETSSDEDDENDNEEASNVPERNEVYLIKQNKRKQLDGAFDKRAEAAVAKRLRLDEDYENLID